MAGAFALGDFAWVHEDLLNQVLTGAMPATDRVSGQIGKAVQELQARLPFYLQAQQKDGQVDAVIAEAESVIASGGVMEAAQEALPEPDAELEMLDFSLAPMPQDIPIAYEFSVPAIQEPPPNLPLSGEEQDDEEVFDFLTPTPAEPTPEPEVEAVAVQVSAEDDAEADAESRLIWQLFWEEVPEQLQSLDLNLQNLRDRPGEQETIGELEREFHTLKGGARMAQLTALADISHEAESLLCGLAGAGQAVSLADIERLQQAVDQLHTLAEGYRQQAAPPVSAPAVAKTLPASEPELPPPVSTHADLAPLPDSRAHQHLNPSASGSMLERLLAEQADSLPDIAVLEGVARSVAVASETEAGEPATPASVSNHETIRLPAIFVDGLIDRAVELNVQQVRMSEHLSGMGLDVDELVRTVARLRQQIRALELESEAQIHDGRSKRVQGRQAEGFDPLEMDQYAEIQRISRSLAESLNDLVNLEADLAVQVRKGEQLLQLDMRTTRKLQQELLNTRLVAVTMLVPRLRRLTRQVAGELGKQVTLDVQGEECELDRNLLQHMTAPLEHLIRNAISHGIETPEQREQQGKPPTGKITLNVSRDDSEIVIRFRDDGRGLDRQRLQEKAVAMGIAEAGQTLPEAELDRLILRPGFSTAQSVSQIAGRGIGMDVVYSELKALGGSLQIESTPNEGVEFIMRLPFTLVVNPVLLAEAQGQVYALPISGVQGVARLSGQQVQEAMQAGEAVAEFAGQPYLLRHLGDWLGTPKAGMSFPAEERFPVVFVQAQGQTVAWVIDRIRGRREVVLQPLGGLFKNCRLYSAATVAPDGSVLLVPDMAELARLATASQTPVDETTMLAPQQEEPAGPPRVMVVDDSITVRRVTEKFLASREYVVMAAKDGMEALEQMAEFQPDVVLLDIEMPRMDGFELLGHLRRDPQWEKLPVIMISSRTAQKHREHAGTLGATGFLGKPYQNEVLLEAINDVLATGHEPENSREWEDVTA